MDGLSILRLNDPQYSILNWLGILTKYRSCWQSGSIAEEAKDYLQQHFFIDPTPYDVIVGCRADDSCFTFAQDFAAGAISLAKLSEAMRPGEKIVLKSDRAFEYLCFIGAEKADAETWQKKKTIRDREARRAYRSTRKAKDGVVYMLDIMREGIRNGDPRLP